MTLPFLGAFFYFLPFATGSLGSFSLDMYFVMEGGGLR